MHTRVEVVAQLLGGLARDHRGDDADQQEEAADRLEAEVHAEDQVDRDREHHEATDTRIDLAPREDELLFFGLHQFGAKGLVGFVR